MEYNASMNIFQRLAAITAELPAIEKDLQVENGNKSYKAISEGAVLACVKPLEEKYHVFSYPLNRKRESRVVEKEYITNEGIQRKYNVIMTDIEVSYRFVNMDNPEDYAETTAYGTGLDTGDKSSGKGMTYADKYALMKMYKISTGNANDPDSQASPNDGFLFDYQVANDNPMMILDDTPEHTDSTAAAQDSPHPMSLDEARAVVLEIGTMKGKTMGEVLALKRSQVEFYAGDKFNNPKYEHYKRAAQILLSTTN